MRYRIIIFDRFCWLLSFPLLMSLPWQSVHHSLPPVQKCNNFIFLRVKIVGEWGVCQFPCSLYTCIRDPYEFLRLLATEQPRPLYISLQNLGQRIQKEKRMMWMIWGGIWLILTVWAIDNDRSRDQITQITTGVGAEFLQIMVSFLSSKQQHQSAEGCADERVLF